MCNTKEKTQLTYCAKGIHYQYFVYLLCINCESIMSLTRIHVHEYTHMHSYIPVLLPTFSHHPPPPTVSVNTYHTMHHIHTMYPSISTKLAEIFIILCHN